VGFDALYPLDGGDDTGDQLDARATSRTPS
jgi:hypothetical protein